MDTEWTNKVVSNLSNISLERTGEENIDQGERALSVIAGGYLLVKSLGNIFSHPILGLSGTLASGFLLYRGATGKCPIYERLGRDTTDPEAINITEQLTVQAPRDKVYAFWRNLSNLPKFMAHLKQVEEIGDKRSHWIANTPGNIINLNWNAEITREEEGRYIGWQSIAGSMIENAGKVEFNDTLNGVGTELTIEINYFPPAGSVGRGITSLFNGLFEKMIREDIQSFKRYVEQADFREFAGLSDEA